MNFYKLGICLGGFGKKRIPEKKLVTIFAENQKDMFVSRYRTGGGKITHKIEKVKMWYEREGDNG
jgi:acyl CoA:acetate/3-ketoacid CoA transferase alpha subunit